jgi:hypothetical protein
MLVFGCLRLLMLWMVLFLALAKFLACRPLNLGLLSQNHFPVDFTSALAFPCYPSKGQLEAISAKQFSLLFPLTLGNFLVNFGDRKLVG